jgi:hypothetical protein
MAAGFINRVKDAQTAGRVNEDQGQRITLSVAKAIETLFRSGAYLDDMDEIREIRASKFLMPKTQLLEYRREEARVEFKALEMRDGLETADKAQPLTRVEDRPELMKAAADGDSQNKADGDPAGGPATVAANDSAENDEKAVAASK